MRKSIEKKKDSKKNIQNFNKNTTYAHFRTVQLELS